MAKRREVTLLDGTATRDQAAPSNPCDEDADGRRIRELVAEQRRNLEKVVSFSVRAERLGPDAWRTVFRITK